MLWLRKRAKVLAWLALGITAVQFAATATVPVEAEEILSRIETTEILRRQAEGAFNPFRAEALFRQRIKLNESLADADPFADFRLATVIACGSARSSLLLFLVWEIMIACARHWRSTFAGTYRELDAPIHPLRRR